MATGVALTVYVSEVNVDESNKTACASVPVMDIRNGNGQRRSCSSSPPNWRGCQTRQPIASPAPARDDRMNQWLRSVDGNGVMRKHSDALVRETCYGRFATTDLC
ncbi:unnamed protein product [Effrenium voratum]|nr:unnamed protein product [Effrenium voratum]